jgi:DMSO/TMAO reductase YedYZ molybdopterin-dependent catalytic subunit
MLTPPTAPPLLPPGQRAVVGHPRFGTHLHHPPPRVPDDPTLLVGGEVDEPFRVDLRELADLPPVEQVSDLHCVSGWSAVGLRWSGVGFGTFYDAVVAPRLRPGAAVTHVVVTGHDGYRTRIVLADLREPDVMLATGLGGAPLTPTYGAPLRLVSPSQYGYMSVKHLCGIEPSSAPRPSRRPALSVAGGLVPGHPRARVWSEERHAYLPAALVRPLYRLFIAPGIALGAVGAHDRISPTPPASPSGGPLRAVR